VGTRISVRPDRP